MPRRESSVDRQQRRMRSGWQDLRGPFLSSSHHRMQWIWHFHPGHSSTRWRHMNSDAEGCCMPADTTLDSLPTEAPAARRAAPKEQPQRPAAIPTVPEKMPRSPHRRLRWALFALPPLVLIGGAYWYVTGGQVMSTDDAYVNAETVGISSDVSGIVQQIDVTENQHVDNGQILY